MRAVYTALIGGYEQLLEQPIATSSEIPFICLTDDPQLESSTWQVRLVERPYPADQVRSSRSLKVLGHPELSGFEETLWIDNSVLLKVDPTVLFDIGLSEADIALPLHSFRSSTSAEFGAVVDARLDDPARVAEQFEHYLQVAPAALNSEAYWTAILARRWTDQTKATMRQWMDHILRYSRRDQLSFPVALHATGQKLYKFDLDNHGSDWHEWPVASGRKGARFEASSVSEDLALEISRLQSRIDAMTVEFADLVTGREVIIASLGLKARLRSLARGVMRRS